MNILVTGACGFVGSRLLRQSVAAPPGDFRAMMERLLRSKKLNAKELLDDPGRTTSLVTVTALVPAGARLQVDLPGGGGFGAPPPPSSKPP